VLRQTAASLNLGDTHFSQTSKSIPQLFSWTGVRRACIFIESIGIRRNGFGAHRIRKDDFRRLRHYFCSDPKFPSATASTWFWAEDMKTFICAVILLVSLWGESNAQAANPALPATEGSRISGQSFSGFSLLTQRRRTPSIGRDDVIIRAELSKRSAYVGEEVVLTYRLFTSVPIVALELLEAPLLTGFWAENVELPEDQRPERRRLEGKDYSVLPIRQQVLFPTIAGKTEIGRAQFSVAVQSRSRGPFDAFFMNVSKPIMREAGPLSLEVERLPTKGRPRDFSGVQSRG